MSCNESFYNNKSLGFKTWNKVKSNVVFQKFSVGVVN